MGFIASRGRCCRLRPVAQGPIAFGAQQTIRDLRRASTYRAVAPPECLGDPFPGGSGAITWRTYGTASPLAARRRAAIQPPTSAHGCAPLNMIDV
jgi:hypothetical protein